MKDYLKKKNEVKNSQKLKVHGSRFGANIKIFRK